MSGQLETSEPASPQDPEAGGSLDDIVRGYWADESTFLDPARPINAEPCPWCAQSHQLLVTTTGWPRRPRRNVWCPMCNIHGPEHLDDAGAVEVWNRRNGNQQDRSHVHICGAPVDSAPPWNVCDPCFEHAVRVADERLDSANITITNPSPDTKKNHEKN